MPTIRLMPGTPTTGANPPSGPSIWLVPILSQGKPENSQPRSHSDSTQAAGNTATRAAMEYTGLSRFRR